MGSPIFSRSLIFFLGVIGLWLPVQGDTDMLGPLTREAILKEKGRIVEVPLISMEGDLLDILLR